MIRVVLTCWAVVLTTIAAPRTPAHVTGVEGERYRIDDPSTYSAVARTIGGRLRISLHTYGTAFDVNSRKNPFRGDVPRPHRWTPEVPSPASYTHTPT